MTEKSVYEVVRPFGKRSGDKVLLSKPLQSLEGKKFGFMWTLFTNGDTLANSIIDLMKKQFKDIEFVRLPPGRGTVWGDYPHEPSIGDLVQEAGVDAVVVTVGC